MRFRNGNIYRKGRAFSDMVYIKIIRRNSSRTGGLVLFRYHNSSNLRIFSRRAQELKGFMLFNR